MKEALGRNLGLRRMVRTSVSTVASLTWAKHGDRRWHAGQLLCLFIYRLKEATRLNADPGELRRRYVMLVSRATSMYGGLPWFTFNVPLFRLQPYISLYEQNVTYSQDWSSG